MTTSLSKDEKVFLAGAMKSMMLADGEIAEPELQELEVLLERLGFSDYRERLAELEATVNEEREFWREAGEIRRPAARRIIVGALRELLLHEGIPEPSEERLISRLRQLWGV